MQTEETKVTAEKEFSVLAERLYEAWITPEDLKQWWKPSENQLKEVELDNKEGGRIKYVFVTKEGQPAITITGEYKEVKPNEKLVYTWNWDLASENTKKSDHQLTIEFSAADQGSKINVTQENFQDGEAVEPHEQGWQKALEDLSSYLSK
ncbi:SRPBCC family protein [Mucilaginibacter koreensis]